MKSEVEKRLIAELKSLSELASHIQCEIYFMTPSAGCPRGHMGESGELYDGKEREQHEIMQIYIKHIGAYLNECAKDINRIKEFRRKNNSLT